ncbi:hypothetical protein A4R43_34515 [Amycolatopsis albispora]|uniref:Uncharacterized protein n=1 Tax=Amycolatopsis albispora TaxID=1804986 RepID=A0A344LFV9_9PSEU|nr:hypothetical protein A4R43_34515 [Amycolatopsis albispora]
MVIRCERHPAASVRFAERHATSGTSPQLLFIVRASAPGLDARLEDVTNFVTGRELARFLDGLDFRGWEGTRHWVNSDRDLRIGAVYEPGGHLRLTWTLRPWRHSVQGDWTATVSTWMEAGAAKDKLAARLHQFLTADGFPVDYHETYDAFS